MRTSGPARARALAGARALASARAFASARAAALFLPLTLATALALTCAGCTSAPDDAPSAPVTSSATPDPGSAAAVPVGEPQVVASGLVAPWSVVFAGGATLVSERDSARIVEIDDAGAQRLVGTVDGVVHGGEGGLLGLAVGPDGELYVYSTGSDGNRVERYRLLGDAGSLALGAPQPVLDGLPSATTHNGGRIAFGPDGMLYVSVGDARDSSSAQDLDVLAGKILRMTPDGDVPPDNPFPGSLVYSSGHRNVQGLGWAEDGTMFAAEFGQDTWDELNVIEPGGNYGWPDVEGAGGGDGFIDPVQQWPPSEASPSGLAVVGGTVFIANLRGQVLRAVPVATPDESVDYFTGEYGRLRTVTLAPDGDLWFVTGNTDGRGSPGPDDDRILSVRLSP